MSEQHQKRSLTLFLQRENLTKEVLVREEDNMIDVIKSIDVPVDGVLVFHNNVPVPLDEIVGERERITIINVTSGG